MLSEQELTWLVAAAKRWSDTVTDRELQTEVRDHIKRIEAELERPELPLELLIICPRCKEQHVDEGEFATKPHKNHSCQFCGLTFQASGPVESIGVQFFRGYKNGVMVIPSKSAPTISLPTLHHGEALWYTGQKVRFNETARHLGYDMEKTFEIAAMGLGKIVRLEGDEDWVDIGWLEPVK